MITVLFYTSAKETRLCLGAKIFNSIEDYWDYYNGVSTRRFGACYAKVESKSFPSIDGTEFNWQ